MSLLNRKIDQIHSSVNQLLALANTSSPPVPVDRIARLRGIELRYVPFEGEVSGLLFREDEHVIIGVNALHSKTRQRFTVAHELGHLELRHLEIKGHDGLHVDLNFRMRDKRSSQAVDIIEIEANAFAAELLMPTKMIENEIARCGLDFEDDALVQTLARKYKVSLQAMTFRLANLADVISVMRKRPG